MSDPAQGVQPGPRDRIVLAVILIGIGVGSLALQALQATPDLGAWVVLIIGLGLLAAFGYTRQYGYLVPGGIVTGIGAGILASQSLSLTDEQTGGIVVLGLGLGFVSIWVIGMLVHVAEHHPWPLVPGGILVLIGAGLLVGGQAIDLLQLWPVVIIAIGVLVLYRAWSQLRAP